MNGRKARAVRRAAVPAEIELQAQRTGFAIELAGLQLLGFGAALVKGTRLLSKAPPDERPAVLVDLRTARDRYAAWIVELEAERAGLGLPADPSPRRLLTKVNGALEN